jgi:hypothetical protein
MSRSTDRLRTAGRVAVVPTRVSAKVVRGSVRTTYRSLRFAVRSSIVSFALGLGLGWFLTTPTGRYVLASIRDLVVSPPVAASDDESLAAEVRTHLASAPATWHLAQPDILVVGGHVTLRGTAPHTEGRDALLLAAAAVPGVESVVDVLDVAASDRPPAAAAVPPV